MQRMVSSMVVARGVGIALALLLPLPNFQHTPAAHALQKCRELVKRRLPSPTHTFKCVRSINYQSLVFVTADLYLEMR